MIDSIKVLRDKGLGHNPVFPGRILEAQHVRIEDLTDEELLELRTMLAQEKMNREGGALH